ncbi:MAG: YdiU family protein [Alphaproteobacteria bacterium]
MDTAVFPFDNSYAKLPEQFYVKMPPTPVEQPGLIRVNKGLAELLGLDPAALAAPEGVDVLAGNRVAAGSEPLAMAYAGHQFGGWSPQLGDGRAILLGEVVGTDGVRRDIQLKGSGPTPFSRMGDGRAALGPVLREYIVSEAMFALGIPTTRSLAAVTTGENVFREGALPGAVLTRVAESHIRVGTFQYFVGKGDMDSVKLLADHVIARHYPDAAKADRPYIALLDTVMEKQAKLIAQWMQVGFIHGVMNTDNTAISGETIDYGPCAFMDIYHPHTVFSSIDQMGRYAYANQPTVVQWNLARFAQCLLPFLDEDEEKGLKDAQEMIDTFPPRFDAALATGYQKKLGLGTEQPGDIDLAQDLLKRMVDSTADFTNTFRRLANAINPEETGGDQPRDVFREPETFDAWAEKWRARLKQENATPEDIASRLRAANPKFIPRNHLVEEAIRAAEDNGDFSVFHDLVDVLEKPYEEQPGKDAFTLPPRPDQIVQQTFCGT